MKNKLLVLSLGALCVSQIWESNRASAVVSGEKNPYVSESLKLTNNKNKSRTVEEYKKSLDDLIWSFPNLDNERFDNPEYKEAMKKYQQRFMAEDEALKKFFSEEKKIKNGNTDNLDYLGLSHERYESVFNTLKKQSEEFLKEIEDIKKDNPELKDFNEEEQLKCDLEYDFEHKQRIDNENDKKLVVSAPTKKPTSPTTYTETTTQVPMPTVERQTQQQIIYNAPKQLAGLNGESHDFTTTHQSPTTSNHTHNNVVEFEETSALPGRKSGSLVGISQIDSSHLTEREKRVIKREHVREAQKLVDNYKDTHSYKDRLNAQQKVNTLSEGHQKRFNKQINKVYNGK
ncbi:TPA: hypothetical protein PQ839_002573 [Staphylococcus aureus]|uniref:hypothetical protein n=1 Tax=Staphylococcus aureus TaxID=1280 RepID=UPI0013FBC6A9|nr:hypothetical protein [Staphylococcus aureus]HDJ6485058.1 hypothetical protein [Staphylococcus aureus]